MSFFVSACGSFFEMDSDVQAKKALQDLMKIQEAYHKENARYARNLVEIEKYSLKYHTGIVYLEIESADKDAYRAISLPAESTTARVFAYDTGKGGYYEMDEEEVSRYVLGALNFIREEHKQKRINVWSSYLMFGVLLVLGIRITSRYMGKNNVPAFGSFFLSLAPLGWSIAILNHMEPEIVLTPMLTRLSALSVVAAVFCLVWGTMWIVNQNTGKEEGPVMGLFGTTVVIALFSVAVMVHTLLTYYGK